MVWIVMGVLSLIPLGVYALCRRFWGARPAVAIAVSGALGFGLGAFLASAGSAMATAVEPEYAFWRGGGFGLLGGIGAGGLGRAIEMLWDRKRRGP